MIKVGRLDKVSPHYSTPDSRARNLAHASLDYFRACALAYEHMWSDDGLWFQTFLLPTMHQSIELGAKAVALLVDPTLDVAKYRHRTIKLMRDFSSRTPVFELVLNELTTEELLANLEQAYLSLRYGECYHQLDGDDWRAFDSISERFFEDLTLRTGLRFPMAHRLMREGEDTPNGLWNRLRPNHPEQPKRHVP